MKEYLKQIRGKKYKQRHLNKKRITDIFKQEVNPVTHKFVAWIRTEPGRKSALLNVKCVYTENFCKEKEHLKPDSPMK